MRASRRKVMTMQNEKQIAIEASREAHIDKHGTSRPDSFTLAQATPASHRFPGFAWQYASDAERY
jgi:hypothetical protein